MKNELRLFVSPITDRVYASSAWKRNPVRPEQVTITGKKYDVTESFLEICEVLGYKREEESKDQSNDG